MRTVLFLKDVQNWLFDKLFGHSGKQFNLSCIQKISDEFNYCVIQSCS